MNWIKDKNGHHVEVGEHYEQGGGVEEIYVWCHTCDPTGKATPTFAHRDYPKWRLAFAAAFEVADRHIAKFATDS